jgi:hypothetical protein
MYRRTDTEPNMHTAVDIQMYFLCNWNYRMRLPQNLNEFQVIRSYSRSDPELITEILQVASVATPRADKLTTKVTVTSLCNWCSYMSHFSYQLWEIRLQTELQCESKRSLTECHLKPFIMQQLGTRYKVGHNKPQRKQTAYIVKKYTVNANFLSSNNQTQYRIWQLNYDFHVVL